MSTPVRVDVAGAGVLGLACALVLARAGVRVRVFDPAPAGQNASGVAAGMLAPASEALTDPAAAPHLALLSAARDAWPAFAQTFGLDLDRSGAVLVGDEARLEGLSRQAATLGLALQPLGRADLPPLPGGISARMGGGFLTLDDWRIEAQASILSMASRARDLGVTFVAEPLPPSDADALVLAGGLSEGLTGQAPELAGLRPIRGHILVCESPAYGGPVIRGAGAYAAPAGAGLLIGATMEPGEATAEVSPAVAAALAAQAEQSFPGIGVWPWTAQAGVRAAAPDGLPLVGRSVSGAFICAGARRNGWLIAPLAAQLIADLVLDRAPGPWARALDPRRFAA